MSRWQWRDTSAWTSFDATTATLLASAHRAWRQGGPAKVVLQHGFFASNGGRGFSVDLASETQTNLQTGFQRAIRMPIALQQTAAFSAATSASPRPAASNNSALVAQFASVTGSTARTSRYYVHGAIERGVGPDPVTAAIAFFYGAGGGAAPPASFERGGGGGGYGSGGGGGGGDGGFGGGFGGGGGRGGFVDVGGGGDGSGVGRARAMEIARMMSASDLDQAALDAITDEMGGSVACGLSASALGALPCYPFVPTVDLTGGGGSSSGAAAAALPSAPPAPPAAAPVDDAADECECQLCFREWGAGDRVVRLQCFHAFCEVCEGPTSITQWLREHGTCPMCSNANAPEQYAVHAFTPARVSSPGAGAMDVDSASSASGAATKVDAAVPSEIAEDCAICGVASMTLIRTFTIVITVISGCLNRVTFEKSMALFFFSIFLAYSTRSLFVLLLVCTI